MSSDKVFNKDNLMHNKKHYACIATGHNAFVRCYCLLIV